MRISTCYQKLTQLTTIMASYYITLCGYHATRTLQKRELRANIKISLKSSFFESRYSQIKARCKERVEQQSEKTGTVLDFISAQIEERPLVLGHAKYRGKHNMYPGPRTYQSVQFLDKGMMNLISNLLHALESLRHILIAISICSFESMQAEKWKYLFSEISSAVFFKYKRQRLGR